MARLVNAHCQSQYVRQCNLAFGSRRSSRQRSEREKERERDDLYGRRLASCVALEGNRQNSRSLFVHALGRTRGASWSRFRIARFPPLSPPPATSPSTLKYILSLVSCAVPHPTPTPILQRLRLCVQREPLPFFSVSLSLCVLQTRTVMSTVFSSISCLFLQRVGWVTSLISLMRWQIVDAPSQTLFDRTLEKMAPSCFDNEANRHRR